MKYIIFLVCVLSISNFYAGDKEIISDVPQLASEINKQTGNRWKISGSKLGIRIESKEQFLGKHTTACGPLIIKNTKQAYSIHLSFHDKISPEKYEELVADIMKQYSMLLELAKKKMKNEQMKGHWQFYPKTEEEWKLYMEYDCIKQKLDDIPQYYYKGIGLRYEPYWSHYEAKDENDKTYLRIKDDIKTIFAIFKKY